MPNGAKEVRRSAQAVAVREAAAAAVAVVGVLARCREGWRRRREGVHTRYEDGWRSNCPG